MKRPKRRLGWRVMWADGRAVAYFKWYTHAATFYHRHRRDGAVRPVLRVVPVRVRLRYDIYRPGL
jgi:hypothetical protein